MVTKDENTKNRISLVYSVTISEGIKLENLVLGCTS